MFKYNLIIVSIDTNSSIITMATKTQEKILEFLISNKEQQITIRGLAKKLNKSYTLVYNNLNQLVKEGIIKKRNVPPAQIVEISDSAPESILIDAELRIKEQFLKKNTWAKVMVEDILSSNKNPFFILIVFGSYAKNMQTSKSDIDLLIIVPDKKDINEIETSLNNIYTKAKKSIIFIDFEDMREMISNPNIMNVGNEAKKKHVILYGVEQYFNILKQ